MIKQLTSRFGADFPLRLCSGVVLAIVAGGALFLGGHWFFALVAFAAAMMALEWRQIGGKRNGKSVFVTDQSTDQPKAQQIDRLITVFFIVLCLVSCWLVALQMPKAIIVALVVGGAIIFGADRIVKQRPAWQIIGLPVIVSSCTALIWLRNLPEYGFSVCIWLLLVVAAADIGGYIFGRLIGGPKLAPKFSPKKTWAGFVGGMIFAGGVGAVFSALTTGTWVHQVGLVSMVAAMVAPVGDIAESAYKRHHGVKDSGICIPGHGGILDRVDGLIAAALITGTLTLIRGQEIFIW